MSETGPVEFDAEALWDLVPDALLAIEPSGRIAAANAAAGQIFGTEIVELIGRPVESLIDEGVRADHVRQRHDWMRSPTPRLMGENRIFATRAMDGRRIDVQVALNPVVIDSQTFTLAVIRDVTDNSAAIRAQAVARDEIVQRLFGLGMSLRSVLHTVDKKETVGRIEAVVEGMSDVVEGLDDDGSHRLPQSGSEESGRGTFDPGNPDESP